jgi:hypothetical protein
VSQAAAETSVLPSSARFSPSAFRRSTDFPFSAPLASQPCHFPDTQSMHSIIIVTVQPESDGGSGTSVDIGLIVEVAIGRVLGLALAVTAGLAVLVRGFLVPKSASSPRGSDSDEGPGHVVEHRCHSDTERPQSNGFDLFETVESSDNSRF